MKLGNDGPSRQVLYPGTCRRQWQPRYTEVLVPWLDVLFPIPAGFDYPESIEVASPYEPIREGFVPPMLTLTRQRQEGPRTEHPLTGASPYANCWWWVAIEAADSGTLSAGLIVAAGERRWPIIVEIP